MVRVYSEARKQASARKVERSGQTMDFRVEDFQEFDLSQVQKRDYARSWSKLPRRKPWLSAGSRNHGPFWGVLYEERRRLATGAVALLAVWLFVHVMFGANGMVIYRSKRAERQKLQSEIEKSPEREQSITWTRSGFEDRSQSD